MPQFPTRRTFLTQASGAAAALAFSALPFSRALAAHQPATVQDIINLVLKEGNLQPIPNTVDTLKSGNPDMEVTGIVTTMFATVTVIKEAIKLGANFIIAHEPTFFNHADKRDWTPNNQVIAEKAALLAAHKIAVWRCHDYIHAMQPDTIFYGFLKKTGWLPQVQPDHNLTERVFNIPTTTLGVLVNHLKSTLGIDHFRIIGDLQQPVTKIGLRPGAPSSESQVQLVEQGHPDVLIIGETREWETAEYIRDGRLLGHNTALIILGHIASEQPGMEYFAGWLQPKAAPLEVHFVATAPVFTWV